MQGLHANATPFYRQDLSILGVCGSWDSWNQRPLGHQGMAYENLCTTVLTNIISLEMGELLRDLK
jgi:hypothetical protein